MSKHYALIIAKNLQKLWCIMCILIINLSSMKKYLVTGVIFVAIISSAFIYSNKNLSKPSIINDIATSTNSTSSVTSEVKTTEPQSKPVVAKPAPAPTPIVTPKPNNEPSIKTYSLIDVSSHNSKSSCWTTIGDKVYDITSYIPRHPGGEKNVLRICGKDGTSLFEGQHGGDSKPEKVLASFFIGDLTI